MPGRPDLCQEQQSVGRQDDLAAIHVNDSKKPKGSRVDRHEHIGRGSIGRKGFRNPMTDPRLAAIPKFLETPKDGRGRRPRLAKRSGRQAGVRASRVASGTEKRIPE
jgi:endonuclease IV